MVLLAKSGVKFAGTADPRKDDTALAAAVDTSGE